MGDEADYMLEQMMGMEQDAELFADHLYAHLRLKRKNKEAAVRSRKDYELMESNFIKRHIK